jgi:hypothetical protein
MAMPSLQSLLDFVFRFLLRLERESECKAADARNPVT